MIRKRLKAQRGEGMVSYLMVLALVVLFCIASAHFLGDKIGGLFGTSAKKIDQVEDKVDKIKVGNPHKP